MLEQLTIHLSKTLAGDDYVQIMSPAAFPVNIVLVAKKIDVVDQRSPSDTVQSESSRRRGDKK